MTLDYKILGQLYYGPEINQEPEIPGTSGYYTYRTGSVFNKYVIMLNGSSLGYYSDNGITWTSFTLPSSGQWFDIEVGADKILALSGSFSGKIAYSTDGSTWNQYFLPGGILWRRMVYAANKFVMIGNNYDGGDFALYSTDGLTWTFSTMPLYAYWQDLEYGQDKFVATAFNAVAYSTNGINWTQATGPLNFGGTYLAYGNGKFVILTTTGEIYYSSDGQSWLSASFSPPDGTFWSGLLFGNGMFLVYNGDTGQVGTSIDGINWIYSSSQPYALPYTNGWSSSSLFKDNKFFIYNGLTGEIAYTNQIPQSASGYTDLTWNLTPNLNFVAAPGLLDYISLNTYQEVQISIGGQGTPGSYVEIIDPQSVYTVPSGTETTVTSIFVTNHDSVERTFDLAVVPNGEELSTKHHIRWDMPVDATDFHLINAKITMSAGDSIWVFPSTINKVGFTLFGVEKS